MSTFNNLLTQIELFIRKYYQNEMLKGGILFLVIFLFSFLLVSLLEYFGHFNQTARFILFYTFILLNLGILFKFFVIPLLKLQKLSKRLSLSDAALMIGNIFPEIDDKLQNTLQLNEQLTSSKQNIELLQASIEQRASKLTAIPFTKGIQLSENKKYLKFLLPLLLFLLAVGFFKPSILAESSTRLVNYDKEYVIPAPFNFLIISPTKVKEGENYTLKIKLEGDEIPKEVTIESNYGNYNLVKENNVTFSHTFNNLSKSLQFICKANGFQSDNFTVNVLKKPLIDDITLNLNYPKHTNIPNETLHNLGDVTIPEGTLIQWNLKGKNITDLKVLFKDTVFNVNSNTDQSFKFKHFIRNTLQYQIVLSSPDINNSDTLNYTINVIKDAYPTISVNDVQDSLNPFIHYIDGTVSDDYGFKALSLNIKHIHNDSVSKTKKILNINPDLTKQIFFYKINYTDFNLQPGDRLEYNFTVTDNDALNGFKSTHSTKKIYAVPTLDSLDNLLSENKKEIKNNLDKAKNNTKDIKKNINDIKNELINKKSPDWKDKQELENLLNMQKELQKQIEDLKNKYDQNQKEDEQFLENSELLKEKQELLEKLLNELMDDELKALMEELQKLMEEMNKDKLIDNLEQMEQNQDALEEELDRALELFKNLELDQKLESIENQLNDLAKEQQTLAKETENKTKSNEELKRKQEEINKKFDEIQKDIQEAKEKNQELETPRDLNFDKELEEELDNELNESKENLDQNKPKKAEKNQSKAAEMMKKMADDVAAMQQQQQEQQQEEDMDALRFLLENLITLSKNQEKLMLDYKQTDRADPKFKLLNKEQVKIVQATEIVKDSLIALSKRVYQLESFINDELNDLTYNLDKSLKFSEELNPIYANQHQQYAITSYNNLALMLSEVLEQMQEQQKQGKPGSGSCNKPGGNGSGSPKQSQMTMEQMKQQMKEQLAKMKNGQKPGGKNGEKEGKGGQGGSKPGGNKGNPIPGLSQEEIAKMAFKQAQMKKSLEQLRQELNKDGSGNGNLLNDVIKDLEDLQKDLLNGGGNPNDLYKRQNEIYTRLLESEKALMERGFSEKRESNTAKNNNDSNQINLIEYNKKKQAEIEFLKSVPLGLRVYYKNLINEYFNSVNN
jgi:hypothetical protein